ncbi:MAG TPA: hypothetical protein VF599_01820 [Pyrinomonadaceae bacterium]
MAQAHLNCRIKRVRNRWIKAIAKAAAVILEENGDFLHWEPDQEILYFWSPDSNEIYQVTDGGGCQCSAYIQSIPPQPCYHRATRRLIKNYFDYRKKPGAPLAQIDFATAVFFDPGLSAREKVELLNKCILEGRVELQPRVDALQKSIPPPQSTF